MARATDHKESKATVRVIYRTAKTLADGSHPFWVRIIKDRQTKYVATGLSLAPKYWNEKHTNYREAIRKNYPEPYREDLIKRLSEWERKYSDAAKAMAEEDTPHDAADVADKAIEKRQIQRKYTLLQYLTEQINTMHELGKIGYSAVYVDLRNQLTKFLKDEYDGRKDLLFQEVTVRFLNDFENWFVKRGNMGTSLSVRFRTLRTLYNRAIAEGVAEGTHYPFARNVAETKKFSVGKFSVKTRKRAITRAQVASIEQYQPVGTATAADFPGIRNPGAAAKIRNAADVERLTRAKNVFLFSFYVAGINFVDMSQLRWSNIQADADGSRRISYTRQKTGGFFNLKLSQSALAIINSYKPFTGHHAENYIFDILDREAHKTPTQIKYRLTKMLTQVNATLKEIGEKLGIETKLTTYVSRHSFATNAIVSGFGEDAVRHSLGHQTEAQTRTYIAEFDLKKSDALLDAMASL
jgi:integrase